MILFTFSYSLDPDWIQIRNMDPGLEDQINPDPDPEH